MSEEIQHDDGDEIPTGMPEMGQRPTALGPLLRTQTSPLPVAFTPRAKALMSAEMLDVYDEQERNDGILAEQKARHKAKAAALDDRLLDLRRKLRAGYETQDVVVSIHLDPDDSNYVLVVRNDTGTLVKRRPATAHEQQMPVPGIEPESGPPEDLGPEPQPPSVPRLAHDAGVTPPPTTEDAIEAEFTERSAAYKDGVEGYKADESNPHDPESPEGKDWAAGYNDARREANYKRGWARHPFPVPDDAPEACKDGWNAAAADKRKSSDFDPSLVRVAEQLGTMAVEARADYLSDLPTAEVRGLWRIVFGRDPHRKRTTAMAREIVEQSAKPF